MFKNAGAQATHFFFVRKLRTNEVLTNSYLRVLLRDIDIMYLSSLCTLFAAYLINHLHSTTATTLPNCQSRVMYTKGIVDPLKTILNCSLYAPSATLMTS